MFLDGLKAVFVGEALGPERFDLLLQTLLGLQEHIHVALKQVELSLQVEPTAHDQ